MPAPSTDLPSPPPHIAARLPAPVLLRQALLASICSVPAGQPLIRAAWNAASIFPARVTATHRFGPPAAWQRDGAFPFHWVYAAADEMTAVWEACLCRNDVTDPGTFYLARGAADALVCTLRFALPLTLIDLSGLTLSKLGLSDDISSPDHEAMQWFGCMIDAVIAEQDGRIAGIAYPSRKQRGHVATAISSRSIAALAPGLAVVAQPFSATAACAQLKADPCRRPPPH